ncbi:MAG: hypothetical protein GY859_44425, partial [Desulfobacterales bacterium]|nr:hypothetical protein [Desulfobacterales bacterium]
VQGVYSTTTVDKWWYGMVLIGDAALKPKYAPGGVFYVESLSACGGGSPCYSSIQGAIDAAPEGALIKVAEGNYAENIVIDKAVTLELGWNAAFTTLDQPNPIILAGP